MRTSSALNFRMRSGKASENVLIHDLGEAFTGDIPTFEKTEEDEKKEEKILEKWLMSLPKPFNREMTELFQEMSERKSLEAKIFKALDNLEALIQHNESDIHTWIPLEYSLQMTYGNDKAEFSDYMKNLRDEVRKDSMRKIREREAFSCKKRDLRYCRYLKSLFQYPVLHEPNISCRFCSCNIFLD